MGKFPTLIERLRVEQDLSYEALAARAGLQGDTIRKYAQGRVRRPRFLTLRRIAEALGADVWDLARDYREEAS